MSVSPHNHHHFPDHREWLMEDCDARIDCALGELVRWATR